MNCLVESSTIHDDLYLNFNDLHEQNGLTNNNNISRSFESANGFSYKCGNDYRFIIWRINGNKIELIEHSLIHKLDKNAKRIHFSNAFIIPNVCLTEFDKSIHLLLATSIGFYRFIFPINIKDNQNSIFHNITSNDLFQQNDQNIYQIDLKSVDYCSICVTSQGEALFTYQTQTKSLCCIKLPSINQRTNLISKLELNQPNFVSRIVSSLKKNPQESLIAFKIVTLNDNQLIVSLCLDFKIKIWNLKTTESFIENISSQLMPHNKVNLEDSKIDVEVIDNHSINLAICCTIDDKFYVYSFQIKYQNQQIATKFVGSNLINNNEPGKLIDIKINGASTWISYKNDDNEFKASFSNDNDSYDLLMEHRDDKDDEITFDKCVDHKEAYLKSIFEPFRFSKLTICKALSILKQSVFKENEIPESFECLKEKIIESIENEVRNHPNIQNCTEEEEFLDITSKCWSKFYSLLLQYDYDARQSLGLFVDQEKNFVLLIRKNSVSLFTAVDLANSYSHRKLLPNGYFKNFFDFNKNISDRDLREMNNLFDLVKLINKHLKLNLNSEIDEIFVENQSNNDLISQVTDNLISTDSKFCDGVTYILNKISNFDLILKPLDLILKHFKLSVEESFYDYDNEMDLDNHDESNNYQINSEFTINILLASFKQLILNRFELIRSLLVALKIIIRFSDKFQVSQQAVNHIEQNVYMELMFQYNGYEVLKWLSQIYPYPIHKSSLEKNFRRTNDLIDTSLINRNAALNLNDCDNLLLKSFLQIFNRNILTTNYTSLVSTLWFPSIVKDLFKKTWPTNPSNDLIRYLMYNVQFVHLNNYCIQMKWWNEGKNFRYFLLAHCCLYSEDIDKSVNFFLKASLNLEHNLVLRRFLNFNDLKDDQVSISYFLKIIHYYDINGNIDAIIDLIDKAILCCKSEANRSRFYCILFKSYMDLEYYENAFETLMINSDIEWKRNCLKQFIIELCNQNKAIELIKFDYSHMQEFVKEILYQRAKSADLRTHDYYGLLYSFYLKNEDYRKAASFMYEYAIRLKNEMNGMQSLKKQEMCYLTCLNTLKLVNKEFSFISIPSELMLATKGQVNGEVLVEFDEINRNYLIVHYILKISSLSSGQSSIATYYSVDELVGLLVKHGLFDDAIILCLAFKPIEISPLVNIFNSFVDRCCRVFQPTSANDFQLEYDWFKFNESLPVSIIPYEDPSNLKWKLLHIYLEKYNDVVYYKAVCKRLLTLGFEIPNYILNSFKKLNTSALLQILITYGLLEEAYDLCIDYMVALVTNKEIDKFDIKNTIQSTNYPVLMPYTCIDQLIIALGQSESIEIKKLQTKLIEQINDYFDTANRVNEMKLTMKY